MTKEKLNSEGITLIALVVTIVVLLILAGVSLNLVIGNNGIITKAKDAKKANADASVADAIALEWGDYEIEVLAKDNNQTFTEFLLSKTFIDSDGVVNTENLLGRTISFGNGTDGKDVYKVEKTENDYILFYYDKEANATELWRASIGIIENIEETATKHPEQTSSEDIGIAEDGTIVNLDLWTYTVLYSGEIMLGIYDDDGSGVTYYAGYSNSKITDDGEIQGKVPMKIKIEGNEEFSLVTSMKCAFFNCTNLVKAPEIPSSVTDIERIFYGCSGLTSITIPDSVTSIGSRAFYNCSGLTSITIPDSVTSIGSYAFYNCSGLTNITIGNEVTNIGYRAFYGTPWLTAKREENPVVIVNNIIIDATTATGDVVIPDSVTSIGDYAFYNCSGLTSITIPDSVTSIGYEAFYNCSGLTSITIPNSVTSIGSCAFYGCSKLTIVNYTGSEAEWSNINIGILNTPLTSATINYNYSE